MDARPAEADLGRIELVATDLDGTVIRHGGVVSPRTLAAFSAIENAGIPLVFVTGRPPRWMSSVVEATGHRGVAVCANGALVYDLHTEKVLERFCIEPAIALETVRRIRAEMPGAAFATEQVEWFGREPAYQSRMVLDGVEIGSIEELVREPVAKLLVRLDGGDSDDMLRRAEAVVSDLVTVTHSNDRDCLLEISALGVTKATTLARFAAERGVAAERVLAFGDQPNDLAMLAWAGTAYAVANAHPDVLAAIPQHALSVDDDGVAVVIEQMLAAGRFR
jgi:Cof subfamily protein (haloacid dehalogenase superfamily)